MPRLKKKLRSQKSGLPPGALVHIGEIRTQAPLLSLIEFNTVGCKEENLNSLEALDHPAFENGVRWLNMYGLHDAALLGEVAQHFALHPLVGEDILNTNQRAKIEDYEDYLFIVVHLYDVSRQRDDLSIDQISLVIGHDFLLTFQERPSGTFAPIRQRLKSEKNPLRRQGCDYLAYSLLDAIVDSYFGVIERLTERAEELEETILKHPKSSTLQDIHALKMLVMQLRRTLWPLRETLNTLLRGQNQYFKPETQVYLRDVYDHTVHVLESLDDLRELLTGLLDVYLSTLSNRVNMEVRRLTVITTVFMPATLIAGIFGMNFHVMPWLDNPDGFWLAVGLMSAVALSMTVIFWIRRRVR